MIRIAANNNIGIDDGSYMGSMNDHSANNYPWNEQVSYFMEHCPIASYGHASVEAAYIIEALTLVHSAASMKKPNVALKVQETYKNQINAIPNYRYADSGIKSKMMQGYFRAKKNSPVGMLIKADDTIGKVCAMAAAIVGIGTPLHKLPSGKGLHDVWWESVEQKKKEHLPAVKLHAFNSIMILSHSSPLYITGNFVKRSKAIHHVQSYLQFWSIKVTPTLPAIPQLLWLVLPAICRRNSKQQMQ